MSTPISSSNSAMRIFFLERHRRAGRLLAVTQCRVEYSNLLFLVTHGRAFLPFVA